MIDEGLIKMKYRILRKTFASCAVPFTLKKEPFTGILWIFLCTRVIITQTNKSVYRGAMNSTMQILEHQSIYLNNLISYKLYVPREKIPDVIRHILENIGSLNLQPTGKILFTEDICQHKNTEILIPVNRDFEPCEQYGKKEIFKLINAVSARHEGVFSDSGKTEQRLLDYIREKSYHMITLPYYSVVRLDPDNPGSCILDIYIGVNYNIL